MSVLTDHVVFKGKTVFYQIKLLPRYDDSVTENSEEVDAHIVANENSSRLTCYAVQLHDEGAHFKEKWSLEFDKIHDFGFLKNSLYVADGESSEKQLFQLSLDSKSKTELDISKVSSKGAWKLACNEKRSILLLYVKHTNDLHLYKDSIYVCQVQSPFSGQVSQMEMTSSYIIVGLLEKHVVQVYSYDVIDSTSMAIDQYFSIDAFWGNFGLHGNLLYTSVMGSQKEVEMTNLGTRSFQKFFTDTKFVPLAAINSKYILAKERHCNTKIHIFILPSIELK